jgi:hypothetical protein
VAPSNPKPATRREIRKTREEVEREYAWVLALASEDESGSLNEFFNWVTGKYVENRKRKVPLAQPFTQAEFDREFNKTDWKQKYTSFEAEARRQQADPRLRNDWLASIETNKDFIRDIASQYGVQLTEDEITDFATQSRLQDWDQRRIERALQPMLQRTIEQGEDLIGRVGDAETDLLTWTRSNGLDLSRSDLAPYISRISMGTQSLRDAQADIRTTYLAGMYPAWADRIKAGDDPSVIFAPYRNIARQLLEMDDLSLDDPIMKRAAQYVGPDGKPAQLPLYEFEKQIRKDSRWQYTDNAYKEYTDVGTDLLRMFGFRR